MSILARAGTAALLKNSKLARQDTYKAWNKSNRKIIKQFNHHHFLSSKTTCHLSIIISPQSPHFCSPLLNLNNHFQVTKVIVMGQQTPWSSWYIKCIKAPLITWAPGLTTLVTSIAPLVGQVWLVYIWGWLPRKIVANKGLLVGGCSPTRTTKGILQH